MINQLNKHKEKRITTQENYLGEVKALLSANDAAERQALKELGLDLELQVADKNTELNLLNQQYSEKFEGKIYHIDEIKAVGIKYRLFMKTSNLYKGKIPADLGSIIVRLCNKHNLELKNGGYSNKRFWIMAPPNMFKDYQSIGDKVVIAHTEQVNAFKTTIENIKKSLRPINNDPTLFFKIDDEHYLALKSWGGDLSFGRRIAGILNASSWWTYPLYVVGWALSLYVLFYMLWWNTANISLLEVTKETTINYNWNILYGAINIVTFAVTLIICAWITVATARHLFNVNRVSNNSNWTSRYFWNRFQ